MSASSAWQVNQTTTCCFPRRSGTLETTASFALSWESSAKQYASVDRLQEEAQLMVLALMPQTAQEEQPARM